MGLYAGNKFVITNSDIIVSMKASTTGIGTTENKKLTPSDGAASDYFGYSVAVGSGKIVVGSPYDDDNGYNLSGSAYIYDLDGNNEVKITASDAAGSNFFGISVAAGSGKIVVGAYKNSGNGAAYIYDLDGTNEVKITASDGAIDDYFGYSVAVGCGKIVVGAFGDNLSSGSAYIYDLDGTNEVKITASNGGMNDYFGWSVAIGDGRIVVGAYGNDNSNGTDAGSAYIYDLNGNEVGIMTASNGANGDQFGRAVAVGSGRIVVGASADHNSNGTDAGSAYIYDLNGNEVGIMTASDGAINDYFGDSVAVRSSKIVVGAEYADLPGPNNEQGSVYIYDLDGSNEVKITASDGAAGDYFGNSVAVGEGRIVVGAHQDDHGGATLVGSAYIWEIDKTLDDHYDEILDHYRY